MPTQSWSYGDGGMDLDCALLFLLIVLAAVCFTKADKIARFAFCCFKHANGKKYPCEEDRVYRRTHAKHQN